MLGASEKHSPTCVYHGQGPAHGHARRTLELQPAGQSGHPPTFSGYADLMPLLRTVRCLVFRLLIAAGIGFRAHTADAHEPAGPILVALVDETIATYATCTAR